MSDSNLKIGDNVILETSAGTVSGVVYWLPSNGSVHVENDTHNFRIAHQSLFNSQKVVSLNDDQFTVQCKIKIEFSENQNVMLHNRWKNSGSELSLTDWIISLTA